MPRRPNPPAVLILVVTGAVGVPPCAAQGRSATHPGYPVGGYPVAEPAGVGSSRYGVVPGPPARPAPVSRPGSWPTAASPAGYPPPGPARPPCDPVPLQPCEGAKILARVGSDIVLASEVMAGIDEMIERNRGRMPEDELQRQRELLIRQRLRQQIETKLIYGDAKRAIPEERFPEIEKSLRKQFEETELPSMMERGGVATRQELDEKLRQLGTSLEREKRTFVQRALAREWVRQQVKPDEEITYDQMLEYYRNHLADFERPARARWEELMVRFSESASRADAHGTIAWMGNQVLRGVPFADVAKRYSDGVTASEGGNRNWTTKGALVCAALDQALFGLPVGRLSPILESEKGFHIVRVIEREEATRTPFLEAQVEIQSEIRRQRIQQELEGYVARLRKTVPVWTIFDGQPESEISRRHGGPLR